MEKVQIIGTAHKVIILQTERRTDAAARAFIDAIAEAEPGRLSAELIERAKADRATLDDVKKRMQPASMEETETRRNFYRRSGLYMSIPKADNNYILTAI